MAALPPAGGSQASASGAAGSRWGGRVLDVVAGLVLLYLFIPVFVIVLYSFNRPEGRFNFVWKAFSFDAWRDPFKYDALVDAMALSLKVAALSTGIATLFGTMIALALCRYRFRGSAPLGVLLVLPLTTPEVVLGSALLTLFLDLDAHAGFLTIVIAHVLFQVSYVSLTVKARIRGFDWTLEDAAMDLGAPPLRVVTKVTLPLIAPGIAAACMLSFALSLDDFIITLFNSGSRVTYPLYVYGAQRAAYPPQINVMATAILVLSLVALGLTVLWQRRVDAKNEA